jgi:hypothetical protein
MRALRALSRLRLYVGINIAQEARSNPRESGSCNSSTRRGKAFLGCGLRIALPFGNQAALHSRSDAQ